MRVGDTHGVEESGVEFCWGAGTAMRACGYQHDGIPFLVRDLALIILAAYIFLHF